MSSARCGFTLVEVLIMIAVVAVLTALLLPAAVTVHRLAVRVACSSNLRQLATVLTAYAADNGDCVPAARNFGDTNPKTSPAWFDRLPPYVDADSVRPGRNIFQCAGFRWSGGHAFAHATPKSFKMNTYLDADGRPRCYRFGSVEDEGELVLFIDAVGGETGIGQWGDCSETGVDDSRHRGAVNVLYADGHSQAVVRSPAGTDHHRWAGPLRWRSSSW